MMNAPLQANYPPEVALNVRLNPVEQAEVVARQERNRARLGRPAGYISPGAFLNGMSGCESFTGICRRVSRACTPISADLGGCVLVNRKHPPERRRVTMLHEYGHLLVDRFKPGIDYLSLAGRKPANERFADAFAFCFLMPAESVRRRFQDILSSTGDFQVAISAVCGITISYRLKQ